MCVPIVAFLQGGLSQLFFSFFVYINVVYAYTFMGMWYICTCVHTHVEIRGQSWVLFPRTPPAFSSEKGSHWTWSSLI